MLNNNDEYKYSKEAQTRPYCLGYKFKHRPCATCDKCGFAFDCEILYKINLRKNKVSPETIPKECR